MRPTLRTEALSIFFAAAALMGGCGGSVPLGTQYKDGGNTGGGGATGNPSASEPEADAAAGSGGGNAYIDAPVATGGSAKPGSTGGSTGGTTGGGGIAGSSGGNGMGGTTGGGGIAGSSGGRVGGATGSSAPTFDAGSKDGALLCDGVPPPDADCAYGTPTWYCVPIDRGDVWSFVCPVSPSDAGGGAGGRGGAADAGSGGAGGSGGGTTGTASSGASTCTGSAPCQGRAAVCSGQSCGGVWTCQALGLCGDVVFYCGCDGVTFTSPYGCPNRPDAYLGTCETGANCSQAAMSCTIAGPACAQGQVPEILNGCYTGRCVPIGSCGCTSANDCPDTRQYTCNQSLQRCTYYL
jgi:hypothetical protein